MTCGNSGSGRRWSACSARSGWTQPAASSGRIWTAGPGGAGIAGRDGLRRRTAAKLSALSSIREALEDYQARLESATDLAGEALETRRAETEKLLERIRDREAAIRTRTADRYRQAMRLLGANPSASAARFSEALDSLRRLLDRREDGD